MRKIYLCRHGSTKWSKTGQHTSTTDLPLLEEGKQEAIKLQKPLHRKLFAKVFSSPMKRAIDTASFAGFTDLILDPDFSEWNYGSYEGKTTEEIRAKVPNWSIFLQGAPGGETCKEIEERAKRAIEKMKEIEGDLLVFSHGHFIRVLGAVWVGLSAKEGRCLALGNGGVSILSYERQFPVIELWNGLIT